LVLRWFLGHVGGGGSGLFSGRQWRFWVVLCGSFGSLQARFSVTTAPEVLLFASVSVCLSVSLFVLLLCLLYCAYCFFVVFCFVLLSAGSDLPFYVHRFLGVVSDTTASLAVVVVVLYILFFMYCLFLCFCSYQRLGGCIWFR
jgi:hypothetical protein